MADEEKKAPEKEKPAPALATGLIRDAAKWLIGAFAAIAALLLTGVQLSSVGQLSLDEGRLIAAIAGFGLGLGATLYVIVQNVRVLLPQTTTVSGLEADEDLAKYFADNPELLPGPGETVAAFAERYRDAGSAYEAALTADEQGSSDATKEALKKAKARLAKTEREVREVLAVANWKSTEGLFVDVRRKVIAAAVLAAVGIGLFAWAANPPEDPDPPARAVISPAPVVAELRVKPASRAMLREALGEKCLLSNVQVLEVGGTKEKPEVVTIPQQNCQSARLVVSEDIGIVTAAPLTVVP